MKNYILPILAITILAACRKKEEPTPPPADHTDIFAGETRFYKKVKTAADSTIFDTAYSDTLVAIFTPGFITTVYHAPDFPKSDTVAIDLKADNGRLGGQFEIGVATIGGVKMQTYSFGSVARVQLTYDLNGTYISYRFEGFKQ
jgi:hypothetical protein